MGANINRIFFGLGLGFISGLFFAPLIDLNLYLLGVIVITLFILFLLKKSQDILLVLLFTLSFLAGVIYLRLDNLERISALSLEKDKKYSIECRVFGDIEIKENKKKFFCKPIIENKKIDENLLIYTDNIERSFLHGDILNIESDFSKPEPFRTDTNTVFEYDEYLKTKNVFWVTYDAQIEILKTEKSFRKSLFIFRDKFIKSFTDNLKGDRENLFLGIMFGKNILSDTLVDVFKISGLLHIIALSGYNITVISSWVKSIFSFLGQRTGSVLSIFSIILFVLMTGMPITAIRASIMAIISMIALRSGNIYESLRALFLAVVIMNIINPRLIFYDFSFQLSVLATLGIILLTQKIIRGISKKLPFFIREIIATTVSAQILVLPLILYQTRLLSVVSLPANILILPFVPIVMMSGLVGGVLGFVFLPLSFPFVFLGDIALKVIILLSSFFAKLPLASLTLKDFSLVTMLVLYSIIVFWAYKIRLFSLTK